MIEDTSTVVVNGFDIFIGLILFWALGFYFIGRGWFEETTAFSKCTNNLIIMICFGIPAYAAWLVSLIEGSFGYYFAFLGLWGVSFLFVVIAGLDIVEQVLIKILVWYKTTKKSDAI
jgi:hypothetical protein